MVWSICGKNIYINSYSCDQIQPIKHAATVCLFLYFLEYLQWKTPITDVWIKLCVIIITFCTRWVCPFLRACQHSLLDWVFPCFCCFVPLFYLAICTTICVSVCVCLLCQPAVSWWKRSADSAVSRLPPWHPLPQASASSPSTSPLPPTALIFRNFPLLGSVGLLSALDPLPLLRTRLCSAASCWYQNSKHHIVWHYPLCHMLSQKHPSLKHLNSDNCIIITIIIIVLKHKAIST